MTSTALAVADPTAPASRISFPDDATLGELAQFANHEHGLAQRAGITMVSHAINAGAALLAAKAQVRHGEWLPWLADNFEGSDRTAQAYMQVASNPQRAADLEEPSLRKAIEAVSKDGIGVHGSSETPEWATPQPLFDALNAEFGFTLDVCATAENAKCERYFTRDDDGLEQDWDGVVWMNPPYGKDIPAWMEKAAVEGRLGIDGCERVVCLVPARVDTNWWWDYCREGEIRFIRGRLQFGESETGAPFPSAVVIFGRDVEPCVKWWDEWRQA